MAKEIALYCLVYPKSAEKSRRVRSLLEGNVEYYHSPKAQCITWSYFTPTSIKGAPNQLVRTLGPNGKDLLIGGLEIYTDKSALSTQLKDSSFQNYHNKVKAEDLYSKDEDLTVWYPTAGFISREETAPPYGNGVVVITAVLTCKDGMRDQACEDWGKYAEWVKKNEPHTLTYSIMTRPKAPNEILVFERFRDNESFNAHRNTKEIEDSFSNVLPFIASRVNGNQWDEVDSAFVGRVVGGAVIERGNSSSKL